MNLIMVDPFTVFDSPMRSSSRSWVTAQRQDSSCQSSFVSRDKILNGGDMVASISCCKETIETKFNRDLSFCEEDFIPESKADMTTDNKWKFRTRQSQNPSRSRTTVSNDLLSYVSVVLLLLVLFVNVSPSVSYDDLCPNVTWSGSTHCNCSVYSLNVSSCTNDSSSDDLRYSCSCGDAMNCTISVLNSTDNEPLLGNCSCTAGYTGQGCETMLVDDPCASISCLNGSTCVSDSSNSSYCSCPNGFNGTYCDMNINEHQSDCNETNICQNNGTCVDGLCNCTEGYDGVDCSHPNCTNVDCKNRGVCSINGSQWSCNCSIGYEGLHCESDVNECNVTNYCRHNGTCLNFDGGYNCSCSHGYTGNRCESDVNECNISDICLNNGDCSNFDGGYNCTCFPSYSGENCADHDACFFNPCHNNGTCSNWTNTYNCSCTHGFMGINCSEIDHCAASPCVNGSCRNTDNRYECSCLSGYTGVNCSEINHCVSNPCANGTCSNLNNGYNCSCFNGFIGVNCNDRDPCAENPCKNNGICAPLLETGNCSNTQPCHVCSCYANYTGINCDTLIGGPAPSTDNSGTVALIVGLTVGLFVLLVIIVALILAIIVRNKRRNLGTYHPSRQEVANARLEINGGLKPPPEERLI